MIKLLRNCPKCGIEKTYTSKISYNLAIAKNTKCRKCAAAESGFLDRYCTGKNSGEANPFFGKKHSDETKSTLKLVDKSKYKTDDFKDKMKSVVNRGETHYFFGKTHKQFWTEKFGQCEAEKLEIKRRKKISEASTGKNNPMYGKPSPQGSGYGWKGWYKNWFFRSLRELSYVINVIEANEWTWISAEKKDFSIQYVDWENKDRNYFADFLVNNNMLIEVKPSKLHISPSVLSKKIAAEEFCKKKGWIYKIVDPVRLTSDEIMTLHDEGQIKFMDKYEQKYREKYAKNFGDT